MDSMLLCSWMICRLGLDIMTLVIESKPQACLNSVALWATENGYMFSPTKTSAMHFTVHPGLHLRPNLTIYNKKIEYTESVKFLGLIWDEKLTFKKIFE